ncbi:hypothetical protein Noda2021_12630 [Candidatus Dependentiae bacterium Noda2021]|nr:hypothetical protein Noda2021_12630 [Candidatus Dependentiae bacterium Noda2021]
MSMKILLLFAVVAQSCFTLAMEYTPKKVITIEGHTATLIEHIDRARLLMGMSTLSTTLLLRYENGQIEEKGNLSLIANREMDDIKNDNYVFFPAYAMVETRTSNNQKQLVNAVIVGTTDQSILSIASPMSIILAEKRKKNKIKGRYNNQ